MNNGQIYDIVLAVLKKESRGNIVKPDRFTDFLVQAHYEYYNQQYEKWSGSQTLIDSLKPFLVVDDQVALSSGALVWADLTHTYKHLIGARNGDSGNLDARADILTPVEWNEWAGDVVMSGSAAHPVAVVTDIGISFKPISIAAVTVSYLKKAAYEPFFDYYADAQGNIVYFANGVEHTLLTGEVYRDGTTSGDVTSISRELEWEDFDKINIISIILEKIGVSLQAPDVTQYAMALEQKQNVL